MASQAQAGRGTTIGIGTTPTLIGEIDDLPFETPKWNTADVTSFDSGSDAEFITTIRTPSQFTVTGNRVSGDAGQIAVKAAWDAGTVASFKITMPKTATQTVAGDTYTFDALVLSQRFRIQPTQKIAFSMDLQVTGAVTYAAGS